MSGLSPLTVPSLGRYLIGPITIFVDTGLCHTSVTDVSVVGKTFNAAYQG